MLGAAASDALDQAIARLDARVALRRIVELLCTIPGVKLRAAEALIAKCGAEMSVFPTVRHFASRARICPGDNESAGKRRSGRTRPVSRWLRQALTEAAKAAARSKRTYLASHLVSTLLCSEWTRAHQVAKRPT